jgi:autotransporter-associated beta strand protein
MMRLLKFALSVSTLVGMLSTAQAETKYWDTTGDTPGAASGAIADGDWDLATPNWSTGAAGDVATTTWVAGDDAVFSAGNDVGTMGGLIDGAFVTISGTQTANSVVIEDGYVAFRVGTVDTGAGTVTVNAGAILDINTTSRLNTGAGKVVLNGGTLLQTNIGNAGAFLGTSANLTTGDGGGLKGLEVNGIGYIGYDDGNGVPDNQVSVFSGVIAGTGGTVDNGGAGTLVKIGPDQIGIGVTDQDFTAGAPRIHSQSLFTFARLVVKQGAYRLRNGTQDGTVRETAFGAVPLAELADAITLDGGGIGSNTNVTLHANRGVTVSPNGGYFDHGAGAGLTIPGPLSGSGTLRIGSPTSTSASNVTFTLSNPNNVTTFSGNIVGIRGTLQLNSSLTTPNFSNADPASPGGPVPGASTVSVAAGKTFTFGSDNADTSFNGNVRGAGTWRKVGTGTTTFTGTIAGNTHTGDTVIEGGTLSITSPYLSNTGDVLVSTGAALDLSFPDTDTIDQLFLNGTAQATGLWGAIGNAGATFTSALITGTGLLQITTGPVTGVDGDYNDNGVVDAADYSVWRDKLGQSTTIPHDTTPGTVTAGDYDVWKTNFGMSAGSGSLGGAAVPEPAAAILALFAAVFAVGNRPRR